jgi:hypothetical protein
MDFTTGLRGEGGERDDPREKERTNACSPSSLHDPHFRFDPFACKVIEFTRSGLSFDPLPFGLNYYISKQNK